VAGAGILKAKYDGAEIQAIIDALGKASMPKLLEIAESAGAELAYISEKAFEHEKDPVSGKKWEALKAPNASGKILQGKPCHLKRTLIWQGFPDGSVVFGSNVEYARIHQMGGNAGRGKKSKIPARPYMGVPKDFDRNFLNDPKILELLGLGE
jgi:phage virion morphogenesis protein